MFLHVSVCPQGETTWADTPQAGTLLQADTLPLGRYTPLGRYHPPGQVPPLGYGQQAGGTHPAGMHSC